MSHVATPLLPRPLVKEGWIREKIFLGMSPGQYFRSLVTPWHMLAWAILAVGLPLTYIRFTQGIGAVSNLSDTNPWGIWIGIDVLCGVALAAGGFIIASTTHVFGLHEYKPLVRPAILTGFLGYAFVVVGLMFDLGRPWRLPYPMVWSWGTTSVMFEVGWCVALYLGCQFLEMFPVFFEWLGWKRLRSYAIKMTIGLTVAAVMLSTLHQSSLGALFLIAPAKLHPLWYSMYLPVFFIISAITGGIGMIIFESKLSHRTFKAQLQGHDPKELDTLHIGLSKAGAAIMYGYFWLRWIGVAHDHRWEFLNSPLGSWWLVEVFGFIALPGLFFALAVRRRSAFFARLAAVWAVVGLILNRVNVSIIAFNWQEAVRYVPHWKEIMITLSVITTGVLVFQWMVNRMPILLDHPDYPPEH